MILCPVCNENTAIDCGYNVFYEHQGDYECTHIDKDILECPCYECRCVICRSDKNPHPDRKKFIIYINEKEVLRVNTKKEVWAVIGKYNFGSRYQVEHEDLDFDVSEFVPY
jgi:hypothetical protein